MRWRVTPMYAEIFDGLRAYYARLPNRRNAAGFESAATLSFIFGANAASLLTVGDYLLNGNQNWSMHLFGYKSLVLLFGCVVAYAHVLFGKHTGRYNSVEPARSSRWKRYLFVYVCASIALTLGTILLTVLTRRS
jgi:hypothetical protein